MKKAIVSLVLLISACVSAQPIPGAAYAVITGLKGGKLVITKGGCSREHGVINDGMNMLTNGIEYLNYRGEVVPFIGEKPVHLEEFDLASDHFTTDYYDHRVEEIRARLTDLPEVRSAKIMLSNTEPGRQSIQLFDRDGHFIKSTTFEKWGSFRIGSALPEAAILALRAYVRNPQELSLLSVCEIRERYS